jgi:hypothetical protein
MASPAVEARAAARQTVSNRIIGFLLMNVPGSVGMILWDPSADKGKGAGQKGGGWGILTHPRPRMGAPDDFTSAA